MGRDPNHFPDPLAFKPERFLDASENGGVEIGTANLPFQYGPRRCLGERMAILEASYFLFTFAFYSFVFYFFLPGCVSACEIDFRV